MRLHMPSIGSGTSGPYANSGHTHAPTPTGDYAPSLRSPWRAAVDATHVNRILEGSETKDAALSAYVDANDMLLITKDGDFRDTHFLNGCVLSASLYDTGEQRGYPQYLDSKWRIANGAEDFTPGGAGAGRSATPLCQLAQYGA